MKTHDEMTAAPTRWWPALPELKPSQSAPAFVRSASRWMLALGVALCASAATLHAQTWETVDDVDAPSAVATRITTDSAGNVFVFGTIKDAAGISYATVMKSSDQGDTWVTSDAVASAETGLWSSGLASGRVGTGGAGFDDHLVTASVANGTKWIIRRSLNAGATWATLDLFVHPNAKYALSTPPSVALDSSGNIYVSGTATETIRKGNNTTYAYYPVLRKFEDGAWRTISVPAGLGKMVCVGGDVFGMSNTTVSWQVRKSSDGGNTWVLTDTYRYDSSHANSITIGYDLAADRLGNLYVVGTGQRAVTTGSGKNATTTVNRYWIVREGTAAGTAWTTPDVFELGPRPNGLPAVNEAHAVTVDLNNDVHVTGVGIDAVGRTWVTRKLSSATGVWTTTDAFQPGYPSDGSGIAADSSGNVFATGLDFRTGLHRWIVRRNFGTPAADAWVSRPGEGTTPRSRVYHSTVWTGSEMIVWGGNLGGNTGDRYNPLTNTWMPLSTVGAPAPRYYHTAVWTGSEMIVWGGYPGPGGHFNDGGRYNPVTDTWTPVSTVGAPAGRRDHTAVWTGSEMIVWGGSSTSSAVGGRYNPATDTWVAMSATGAPAGREYHQAVWTGSEMIVWGGTLPWNNGYTYLSSGGRYHPATDSWVATSIAGAPAPRKSHSAVWTGSEMIVWGGHNDASHFGDGGRYNPVSNTWSEAMSTAGAPSPRAWHSGVWTGTEMIVWGGYGDSSDLNTGCRYDPAGNRWKEMTNFGAPIPSQRRMHSAVWTGNEMTYWGVMSGEYHLNYTYIPD